MARLRQYQPEPKRKSAKFSNLVPEVPDVPTEQGDELAEPDVPAPKRRRKCDAAQHEYGHPSVRFNEGSGWPPNGLIGGWAGAEVQRTKRLLHGPNHRAAT